MQLERPDFRGVPILLSTNFLNLPIMTIEICANSLTSALHAQEAGAHRVELCSELSLGGITPSSAVISLAREQLDIQVFVLIRPRAGDFCYSDDELAVMKRDIEYCREVGCDGVVIGVLKADGTINVEQMQELVEAARPMKVTFHRAFDVCENPYQALDNIQKLGIERILTSGQCNQAIKGISLLQELVKRSDGKVSIMAGSGVSADNVLEFQKIGIREVHFSAKAEVKSKMKFEHPVVQLENEPYKNWVSNVERIQRMLSKV